MYTSLWGHTIAEYITRKDTLHASSVEVSLKIHTMADENKFIKQNCIFEKQAPWTGSMRDGIMNKDTRFGSFLLSTGLTLLPAPLTERGFWHRCFSRVMTAFGVTKYLWQKLIFLVEITMKSSKTFFIRVYIKVIPNNFCPPPQSQCRL